MADFKKILMEFLTINEIHVFAALYMAINIERARETGPFYY